VGSRSSTFMKINLVCLLFSLLTLAGSPFPDVVRAARRGRRALSGRPSGAFERHRRVSGFRPSRTFVQLAQCLSLGRTRPPNSSPAGHVQEHQSEAFDDRRRSERSGADIAIRPPMAFPPQKASPLSASRRRMAPGAAAFIRRRLASCGSGSSTVGGDRSRRLDRPQNKLA
jgi:hypothetical protein